jgi:hypothetical protein
VAVLTVYADDSTDSDTYSVAVLAGYVGTAEDWDDLANEWIGVLSDSTWPSPVVEFKASDCASGKGHFRSWDSAKRNELVGRLIQVITNQKYTSLIGIGAGIVLEDDERRFYKKKKDLRGVGYTAAYSQFVSTVFKSISSEYERVEFVVDEQTKVRGYAEGIFKDHRALLSKEIRSKIHLPIHGESATTPPLQVADLIAYETFRHLHNWRYAPTTGQRPWMRMLREGRKHIGSYFDNRMLMRLLYEHPQPTTLPDVYRVFEDA